MTRYMPVPVSGSSGADHLTHEVTEHLQYGGYSRRVGAERAWFRACRRADEDRAARGLSPVSRPACQVVELQLLTLTVWGDNGRSGCDYRGTWGDPSTIGIGYKSRDAAEADARAYRRRGCHVTIQEARS